MIAPIVRAAAKRKKILFVVVGEGGGLKKEALFFHSGASFLETERSGDFFFFRPLKIPHKRGKTAEERKRGKKAQDACSFFEGFPPPHSDHQKREKKKRIKTLFRRSRPRENFLLLDPVS